ncbi:S41 family peptidase [Alkalihalobacillus pseudalcaliphilus]|uniref:S41 family peptidase n=1 Tax=Alkalihalobacillus pseudalcaliphilus TaxID=79884 RepID=UPI00064E0796|nr:S41 family peptidase [Alkalihalobacillus pseudalcaliphilus]KMK75828.1 hypothetical protein AB990_11225 [Alkalihalobacillus pseudalcaliphilus]
MIEVKRLDKYTKKKREACHTYQEMNADTGYFCLEDFSNQAVVETLLEQKQKSLHQAKYLIFDVRTNYGGNDITYFPLLSYIFPSDRSLKELNPHGDINYVNYTERNVDIRIRLFEEFLESDRLTDSELRYVSEESLQLKKFRGKGFVASPLESEDGGKPFIKSKKL